MLVLLPFLLLMLIWLLVVVVVIRCSVIASGVIAVRAAAAGSDHMDHMDRTKTTTSNLVRRPIGRAANLSGDFVVSFHNALACSKSFWRRPCSHDLILPWSSTLVLLDMSLPLASSPHSPRPPPLKVRQLRAILSSCFRAIPCHI